MTYTIEKNIPLPPVAKPVNTSPLMMTLMQMEVGDSILVTDRPKDKTQSFLYYAKKHTGNTFAMRSTENGARVWRTK